MPAPVSLVAHAVVVALVVVLTTRSLLLWQSEIATVQGEAAKRSRSMVLAGDQKRWHRFLSQIRAGTQTHFSTAYSMSGRAI